MKKLGLTFLLFISFFIITACDNTGQLEIEFDSNGGSFVESISTEGETFIVMPENPTKEGYVFGGWYWDDNAFIIPFTGSSLLDVPLSSDMTVYAKWSDISLSLDSKLLELYELSVESELFTGSYEDWLETIRGPQGFPGEDGKEVVFQIQEDLILWQYIGDSTWTTLFDLSTLRGQDGAPGENGQEVEFQISGNHIQWKYDSDTEWNDLVDLDSLMGSDGSDGREVAFQVGNEYIQWKYTTETEWSNLIHLSALAGTNGQDGRDGYPGPRGVGISNTTVNDSGELIITYTNSTVVNLGVIYVDYTVSFVGLDGNVFYIESVVKGTDISAPIPPVVEGYSFVGWDNDFDNVTEDTIVNALYEIERYNISFDCDGGSEVNPINNVQYGDLIELEIPTKDGYRFLGWFTGETINDGQFTSAMAINQDRTLYARWERDVYVVSFIDIDGQVLKQVEVNPGEGTTAPTVPEVVGYVFTGWSSNYDEIQSNLVIQAQYAIEQYSLNYYTFGEGYNALSSIPLYPDESVEKVFPGVNATALITSQGRVLVWGRNHNGQLGDGTYINRDTAVDVTAIFNLSDEEKVVDLYIADAITCVLTSKGRVLTWGNNYYGSLGDGTRTNSLTPVDITSLFNLSSEETIVQIKTSGYHSIALSSKGRVFTWGRNDYGQLGDGTNIGKFIPIEITEQFDLDLNEYIQEIDLTYFSSIAVTSNNRVFTWGNNYIGQLGNNTYQNENIPVNITSFFNLEMNEEFVEISVGQNHLGILTSFGNVYTWGHNGHGQLGDGTYSSKIVPTNITEQFLLEEGQKIIKLRIGDYQSSSALSSDGKLFTWGGNTGGELGDGTTNDSSVPIEVSSNLGLYWNEDIENFTFGFGQFAILTTENRVIMWGWNDYSQLHDGTKINRSLPTELDIFRDYLIQSVNYNYLDETSAINYSREGYTFNGWYTDLGYSNPYVFSSMPAEDVELYENIDLIYYTIVYNLDGGVNGANPETYNVQSEFSFEQPTKTGYTFDGWFTSSEFTGSEVTEIVTGSIGDLTLYAKWIINDYEVIYGTFYGDYDPSYHISLQPGDEVVQVAMGYKHSSALTSYGRLYLWGNNDFGQLGNGTNILSEIPIDITDNFQLINDEIIIYVDLGFFNSSAITSTGRVFTWGSGASGQLGNGTQTQSEFPYEITDLFDLDEGETILDIELGGGHAIAYSSNNRVFTWGFNNNGQLGSGDNIDQLIPFDITSQFVFVESENIIDVAIGYNHTALLTSSGRMFIWGQNDDGQLGNGSEVSSVTPLELTSTFSLVDDETIKMISLGNHFSSALTSQGRLFMWGDNSQGQLTNKTEELKVLDPLDVSSQFELSDNEILASVELGGHFSTVLTSYNRMFTFGAGESGQLGTEMMHGGLPQEISSNFDFRFNEMITSVSASESNVSITTSLGYHFIWGGCEDHQCGGAVGNFDNHPVEGKLYPTRYESSAVYTYGDEVTEYVPSKSGYTFNGWFIDQDLSTPYVFGTMPGYDLVLYGEWIGTSQTLTYATYDVDFVPGHSFLLEYNEEIEQVSLGNGHSAILTSNNRIVVWGYNANGQLGNDSRVNSLIPVDITSNFDLAEGEVITIISMGYFHSGAVTSEGRLFLWGYNTNGQLGNGVQTDSLVPVDVTDYLNLNENETVTAISLGLDNTAVLTSENRLFVWGGNLYGQIGDGTTVAKIQPIETTAHFNLEEDETIVKVLLEEAHGAVLTSNNRLFMWGLNANYRLGDGTTENQLSPIEITVSLNSETNEVIENVSLGRNHSALITSNNRVFLWGGNSKGQIGIGTFSVGVSIPTYINDYFELHENEIIVDINLGYETSSALTSEGRVYIWGWNEYGQVAGSVDNNEYLDQNTPVDVTSNILNHYPNTAINEIIPGDGFQAVLVQNNILFTWGYNHDGRLGDGTSVTRRTPQENLLKSAMLREEQQYDSFDRLEENFLFDSNYNFSGWYSNTNFEQKFRFGTMPPHELVLYGYWIPKD